MLFRSYLGDTIESLARAGRGGYRVVEVPVEMRARDHGVSTDPTDTVERSFRDPAAKKGPGGR